MAKMMLPLLYVGLILLADGASKLDCAVDGSKSFSDAADAAIYIWAATQRCDSKKGNAVMCTIDIASAVAAVSAMTNIIVKAVDTCDVIHTADEACGELVGQLTTASAALVAGSAGIMNACPNDNQPVPGNQWAQGEHLLKSTTLGECIIDAKSSLSSTFDAMQSLKKIAGGQKSAHNDLNTVSAFASLGSSIASAVNRCSAYTGAGNKKADCVSKILGVVAQLNGVADIASSMSKTCKASASRLYLEKSDEHTSVVTNNSMSLTLAAFLPVAAVLGFVGGRRFGKTRGARDDEAMIQLEIE
jgi:hypothetical protein